MSDVLQCPHCALRFSTMSELEQHKAIDHPQVREEEPAEPEVQAPVEPEPEQAAEAPQKRGFWSRLFGGS
jgi:hypothetical protein